MSRIFLKIIACFFLLLCVIIYYLYFCLNNATILSFQIRSNQYTFLLIQTNLVLGGFYIIVMALYLLFEVFIINYRPVLIDGHLEASYPSSTTMLVLCVIPTAMMQLNSQILNQTFRKVILGFLVIFTAFMVIGRLISGVHWFTDIVGGILLSTGLVVLYHFVSTLSATKN